MLRVVSLCRGRRADWLRTSIGGSLGLRDCGLRRRWTVRDIVGSLKRGKSVAQVFISYRRGDSAGHTGRLNSDLENTFGREAFFQDVEDLVPGSTFPEELDRVLRECDAMLVVIGRDWASAENDEGLRLLQERDFVRREVASALQRADVRVIPVLVDGAAMPAAKDLPDDLQSLRDKQFIEIADGDRWDFDVGRLSKVLVDEVGLVARKKWMPFAAATGAALALAAVLVIVVVSNGSEDGTDNAGQQAADTAGLADNNTTTTLNAATSTAPSTPEPSPTTDAAPEAASLVLLGGEINIAIAAFIVRPDDDAVTAREAELAVADLAASLETALEALVSNVDVGVYERPVDDGSLEYDLEQLATSVNANIVVTAEMESDAGGSTLIPTFYVPSRQLGEAQELTGLYALGEPAVFASSFDSVAVRSQVRDSLRTRSCLLAYYVAGLSFYRERLYAAAADRFERAIDPETCSGDATTSVNAPGVEVAYYFLASIAALAGDLDAADANFQKALSINSQFARARFGQAEVAFQREREACVPGVEARAVAVENLEVSLVQYQQAFSDYADDIEAGRPRVPFLETGARLKMGRVELCLSQAGQPAWDDARSNFEDVVSAYRFADTEDQESLREFAAEAFAGLGLIALTDDRSPPDPESALELLTRAIDLQPASDRLALFLAMRARAHILLDDGMEQADCDAALRADSLITLCSAEALAEARGASITGEFLEFLPFTGVETTVFGPLGVALVVAGAWLVRFVARERAGEGTSEASR